MPGCGMWKITLMQPGIALNVS